MFSKLFFRLFLVFTSLHGFIGLFLSGPVFGVIFCFESGFFMVGERNGWTASQTDGRTDGQTQIRKRDCGGLAEAFFFLFQYLSSLSLFSSSPCIMPSHTVSASRHRIVSTRSRTSSLNRTSLSSFFLCAFLFPWFVILVPKTNQPPPYRFPVHYCPIQSLFVYSE